MPHIVDGHGAWTFLVCPAGLPIPCRIRRRPEDLEGPGWQALQDTDCPRTVYVPAEPVMHDPTPYQAAFWLPGARMKHNE